MIDRIRDVTIVSLMAILFIGCNRSIFYYSDNDGESTFVLYNKNYKYSEKTKNTSFKTHGIYEVTDSTLSFTQFGKENIPYTYALKSIEVYDENKSADSMTITVINSASMEPLFYSTIAFLDDKGTVFDGVETNINGEAQIPHSTMYQSLEISYVGYMKVRVDNASFRNKDFRIEIEEMKPGGRMSAGCLTSFLDVILEYKVDQKKDFFSFSRNGVVYDKIN